MNSNLNKVGGIFALLEENSSSVCNDANYKLNFEIRMKLNDVFVLNLHPAMWLFNSENRIIKLD